VMMFNGGEQTPEPKLTLEGIPLDVVSEFKYLGVVFNTSACMKRAAEYAARPLMAGIKRVNDLGEEYCVKDRPHAMLWLFQSFALPIVCSQLVCMVLRFGAPPTLNTSLRKPPTPMMTSLISTDGTSALLKESLASNAQLATMLPSVKQASSPCIITG